ncbi:DUF3343 domain-containing protein [Sedimentibacter sp.]|uniref:DUF3343 domain-containing protein n=1 Tax=Sedimentibacter sp. TaxID=1960295 RepID=UPI0028B20FA1|nr:DUF3343 domain-containing protein [Sedimentibacter sp.]
MIYTVLFFTHSGSVKFERKCSKNNIQCELMPVPRSLSSNCSISAKIEYYNNIEDLIDDEIEKIFLTMDNYNKLIYEAE